MLRVCVLGELRVERDGSPLALPRRRPARALLGWLALHPGLLGRSTVAAQLWPSVLDESARTSLRTALSALRAALGDQALVATRERVGLAPDVRVDLREFGLLLGPRGITGPAEHALDHVLREIGKKELSEFVVRDHRLVLTE